MHRHLWLLSAVVLVTASLAARPETSPHDVTSLLGRPLAPLAMEPETEERMEAQTRGRAEPCGRRIATMRTR